MYCGVARFRLILDGEVGLVFPKSGSLAHLADGGNYLRSRIGWRRRIHQRSADRCRDRDDITDVGGGDHAAASVPPFASPFTIASRRSSDLRTLCKREQALSPGALLGTTYSFHALATAATLLVSTTSELQK